MAKRVRIGVVGAGFAAHFHLASYRKAYGEDFEIAGIYGRTRAKAGRLAHEHDIPRVYDSVDALLDDPALDAVDLCIPNYMHASLAVRAAKAGKHVICEKPLTGYFGPPGAKKGWTADGFSRAKMLRGVLDEADAVYDTVRKAGVTFCYGENWVYAPPIQKARRLLAASDSTILRITGEESHSGSHAEYAKRWREAGGGSLLRMGVHPIGGALYLKYEEGRRRGSTKLTAGGGKPIRPRYVTAEVGNLTRIKALGREKGLAFKTDWVDVEDFGAVVITFEDGAVAQLTSTDTVMGGIFNQLTIYGSRAVVKCNVNPNNTVQAYAPDAAAFKDEYLIEKLETKAGWSTPNPDEDWVTGYHDEFRDFVGAISRGRPPMSDLALAHDTLVVVYAAYLAAEKGERVDLRPYLR